MNVSIRFLGFARLAGAIAVMSLYGAPAAWAGDGTDLASLNQLLNTSKTGLCAIFNMSTCPQLPTITQAVLQVAGLGNNLPEIVRAQNSIPPGVAVTAGNPAAVPPVDANNSPLPMPFPLNSTTNPKLSDLLSTLTPLAFISQASGTGQPTQLYDPTADAFLYAVGVSSSGFVVSGANLTDPDTVYFLYEDLFRTNTNLASGQTVAKFSFPLTVLNSDGTESPVPVTLQFIANNAGDCSTSTVSGMPTGSVSASQIGIKCAVVFSASPTSPHAIFEVAVRLLVTGACSPSPCSPSTDPAYFYFLHTGLPGPRNLGTFTAFEFDDLGAPLSPPPAVLPSIGLAPTAAPLCSTLFPSFGGLCPKPIPASPPIPFALCASLPNNTNGTGAKLRPAVGADYAMAASGEMLLSAPLPAVSTSACPQL